VTSETWLRLALVPAAVWLASLAARRWGHAVSGSLGGLPLIGGPITLFLALDLGPAFAARSALFTLAMVLGQAAHLAAFAHVSRRHGWVLSLAAGWSAFAVVGMMEAPWPISPAIALALAIAGLAAAWIGLPWPRASTGPPTIPPMELRLRLVAAFGLAGLILWSAPVFGPVASGILLSMPVTGSIMPPFTLVFYGPDAVARLLRGFVVGLAGFSTFFFILAVGLVPWGIAGAFLTAAPASLVAALLARTVVSRTA
jgi:hypothetical protein